MARRRKSGAVEAASRAGDASQGPAARAPSPVFPALAHAASVALLILVAAFFWRGCLDDFFCQDDFVFLERAMNDAHALGLAKSVARGLATVGAIDNGYRPLSTTLYFAVMVGLFDLNAAWYHAVNLAVHTLNGLLVYAIAWLLFRDVALSFACGAVFLTRSLGYVSVFWVSGIQELLGCFFCLIFTAGMIVFFQQGGWRWFVAAAAAYAVGVHAKEFCFLLPACAVPVWFMTRRRQGATDPKRLWMALALLGATGALLLCLRFLVTQGAKPVYEFGGFSLALLASMIKWVFYGSFYAAVWGLAGAAAFYLMVILAPFALRLAKTAAPRPAVPGPSAPVMCLGTGVIIGAPMLFFRNRDVEYYAYAPSAFIILSLAAAVVNGLSAFPQWRKTVYGAMAALLVCSGFVEGALIRGKDQTKWMAKEVRDPDGSRAIEYSQNPEFRATGGFLNTDARYGCNNLFHDLRRWIAAHPGDVPPALIVGWGEVFVGSNIRSADGRMEKHAVTDSMLALLTRDRPVVIEFVTRDKGVSPGDVHAIPVEQAPAFLARYNGKACVLLVNSFEGSVMKEIRAGEITDAQLQEIIAKHQP